MGVLDNTVTQLILVKGDTSQAKSDLKSFRGAEKQAAKERLAEIEATNKGIDAQIARFAKIGAVAAGAVGGIKLAQAAANAYLEDLRLESAAAGINIDRLAKSTRGLVETDNLLAFAGKTQHGVWKLNQAEMEIVAKGTDVLAKRMGMELQPAMEKVTEGIQKGQTRALKELGIEVKDKSDLMRQMTAVAKDWGKAGTTEGEKWIQAQNKLKNAWDDIEGAIGEIVVALGPLLSAIAGIVNKIRELQDMFGGPMAFAHRIMGGASIDPETARRFRELEAQKNAAAAPNGGRTLRAWGSGATEAEAKAATDALALLTAIGKNMDRNRVTGGGTIDDGRGGGITGYERSPLRFAPTGDPLTGLGGGLGGPGSIDSLSMKPGGVEEGMAARAREMAQLQIEAEQRKNLFESIFGTPQAIDATALAVYGAAKAFQLLEVAATAALDAFITGQQSMADAVKNAIAQGLKAVAIDASIQALKNTAYGFAALATGPIGGVSAGQFFKAAALFGGVAVAATVGAKAAYNAGWGGGSSGGGGGAPSGTSAGGYIGGSGGGGGDRTSNTVIYVTGDAYRMSQAEREHRISDAARRGQQKRSRNVGGNY